MSVIYINLISFIVVACYILIKQKAISAQLKGSFQLLSSNFLRQYNKVPERAVQAGATRFCNLGAEISDYNLFWSSYLSFLFLIYVLLLCFIIFVGFFGQTAVIVNIAYAVVFFFHVLSMAAIIAVTGRIVRGQQVAARQCTTLLGKTAKMAEIGKNGHCKLVCSHYLPVLSRLKVGFKNSTYLVFF